MLTKQCAWFGTRQQLLNVTQQSVDVNGVSVAPLTNVHDLGVIIDEELKITAHVNHAVSGCFYQFWQLRSIQHSLLSMPGKHFLN